MGRALVKVGQQLLDAELEEGREARLVGLEQDADAVDFLVVRDEAEDLLEVLAVLMDSPAKIQLNANCSNRCPYQKRTWCRLCLGCR